MHQQSPTGALLADMPFLMSACAIVSVRHLSYTPFQTFTDDLF